MTWAHHFRPSTGRPAPGWEIWRECERNKTAAKSMIRRLAQRGKRAWQNSNPVYLYSNLKKTILCSPCERRGQSLGFCAGRNARECGGLQQPRPHSIFSPVGIQLLTPVPLVLIVLPIGALRSLLAFC